MATDYAPQTDPVRVRDPYNRYDITDVPRSELEHVRGPDALSTARGTFYTWRYIRHADRPIGHR